MEPSAHEWRAFPLSYVVRRSSEHLSWSTVSPSSLYLCLVTGGNSIATIAVIHAASTQCQLSGRRWTSSCCSFWQHRSIRRWRVGGKLRAKPVGRAGRVSLWSRMLGVYGWPGGVVPSHPDRITIPHDWLLSPCRRFASAPTNSIFDDNPVTPPLRFLLSGALPLSSTTICLRYFPWACPGVGVTHSERYHY